MAQSRQKNAPTIQKAEGQMEITSYFQRGSDFIFCFSSTSRASGTSASKNKKMVELPPKKKRKTLSDDQRVLKEIRNPSEAVTAITKNTVNSNTPMTGQRRIFSHVEIFVVRDRLNNVSNSLASPQASLGQNDEEVKPATQRPSTEYHRIVPQDPELPGRSKRKPRESYVFPDIEESEPETETHRRKLKRKSRDEDELETEFVAEAMSSDVDDCTIAPETKHGSIITDEEEDEAEEEAPRKEANEPEPQRETTNRPKKGKTKLDLDLPPLSDIRDIFRDITIKALDRGFRGVTEKGDRVLRIGTMCSGTEAPLLAMRLVDHCLKELGENSLLVKHEFSAEIEPFKQAYIERNFKPPLLFRDVTEFTSTDGSPLEGTTAYGSRHSVPCDIHMLIAGSACVDFSLLNNNPNAKGESEDTRLAIVAYASRARPAIVLLENVIGQAINAQAEGEKGGKEKGKDDVWTRYIRDFAKIGYATQIVKVDTKDYYLPHTRQRKYMLCLDRSTYGRKADKYLTSWGDLMKDFQRPASAPITSFLLRSDDPRYIRMAFGDNIKETTAKSWDRCRERHEKARADDRLGPKRPVTTRLPDHSDRRWLQNRPERDQEVLDIVHLRHARHGIDALFKTRPIDLSQNVDRNESWTWGITGCLTPSGMPFLTDQCRRVTGYEALQLQGIDIDEVTFTSETDANLRDLAGNAMSSTVVGPAILSALIVAHKDLPTFADSSTDEDVSASSIGPRIGGEDQLFFVPTLPRTDQSVWMDMIADARRSSRRCHCEGENEIARQPILLCKECEHSACKRCAGNPKHVYGQDPHNSSRLSPADFRVRWRSRLPARLRLENLPDLSGAAIDADIRQLYLEFLKRPFNGEFSLQEMKRSKNWSIWYRSSNARLEVVLGKDILWQLYVDPAPELAAGSRLRTILEKPVARVKVLHTDVFNLAEGWECYIPFRQQTPVLVTGRAERTLSWRARQGLKDFQEEQVPKQFEISLTDAAVGDVFYNVPGVYELRPDCGTACGSLHKKLDDAERLYFFLDPDPIGDVSNDRFVFAIDHERLDSEDRRAVLAYIDPSWRPWLGETFKRLFTLRADGFWIPCCAQLKVVSPEIIYSVPKPLGHFDVLADIQSCHDATAIVSVKVSVVPTIAPQWSGLRYIDDNDKSFFRTFNWMLVSVPGLESFVDWRSLDLPATRCNLCSPDPPSITWLQTDSKKLVMQEDHLAAALYERSIKNRPPGFVIQAGYNDENSMHIKVGVSLRSLAHQVVAKLSGPAIKLEWNLETKYFEPTVFKFPRFRLRDNEDELEHAQPSKMQLTLRPDQARSLTWMLQQENGVSFKLEEVEEALLPDLGWKAEVKASTNVSFKGGVLADEPSYGKTITSLTIINEEFTAKSPQNILDTFVSPDTGLINSAATLIVTPSHLTNQWQRELAKFCRGFECTEAVVIRSVQDLKKLTANQLCKAKVVIASWSIFMHELYAARLAEFAAYPEPSSIKGRAYRVWQEHAIPELPENIRTLRQDNMNIRMFEKTMAQRMQNREEDPVFQAVVPSKRLKGAEYVAKKQQTFGKDSNNKKLKFNKVNMFISTSSDWKSLQFPILHIYHWNRIIVDEFSYLLKNPDEAFDRSGKKLSYREYSPAFTAVTGLQAEKRWVLSGTPPLRDFVDVNMIASFLGLKLGVDSFTPEVTNVDNFKNIRSELSAFEKFRSYQEKRSYCWHKRRHDLAQSFLDLFVRQNTAKVNDIECFPSIEPVHLNVDHGVVHEELYHHLSSNEMNFSKKGEDVTSDQDRRINSVLAASSSADEALLRSGALLNSSISNCSDRILKRKQELYSLKCELVEQIALAEKLKRQSNEKELNLYRRWFRKQQFGDHESNKTLQELCQRALKANPKAPSSQTTLRVLIDRLERLGRNLTGRIRSLRRLENLNRLLNSSVNRCDDAQCVGRCPVAGMRIITACGHLACIECLSKRNESGKCVVPGCGAEVLDSHIRSRELFGDSMYFSRQQTFGAKLDAIIDLIQSIPEDDQLLLFLQSKDLIQDVKECLENFEISYHSLDRTAKENLAAIEHFQETRGKTARKVLILLLAGEQASGLNLSNANHIVFLSPLLAKTQYDYESNMKQAIRRARRYGQEKPVHVYRFVALNTIDVDIMEQRESLLTEPLWTRDHPHQKSQAEPSREQKPKPEKSRLVRTTKGKFALKPLSALHNEDLSEETYGSQFPLTYVDEDLDYEDE